MRVALVARDLMFSTRIEDAAQRAGAGVIRVSGPAELPEPAALDLVFVDWSEREPTWGQDLRRWLESGASPARPQIILFGPHTDLDAHAAAREARLGPMWARSKLLASLGDLLR